MAFMKSVNYEQCQQPTPFQQTFLHSVLETKLNFNENFHQASMAEGYFIASLKYLKRILIT